MGARVSRAQNEGRVAGRREPCTTARRKQQRSKKNLHIAAIRDTYSASERCFTNSGPPIAHVDHQKCAYYNATMPLSITAMVLTMCSADSEKPTNTSPRVITALSRCPVQ